MPQYIEVRTFQKLHAQEHRLEWKEMIVTFSSPTNDFVRCSSASGHILLVLQGIGTSPQCATDDLHKNNHLVKVQYGPRKYKVPCTTVSGLRMH